VSAAVNTLRGEVALELGSGVIRLRPTFGALVRAEAEAGSLCRLLDRAADGDVRLADVSALLWACAEDGWAGGDRHTFEAALLEAGMGRLLPSYRTLLGQLFSGVE
jgi:hypothetical protein